jgi:hypothetical protein
MKLIRFYDDGWRVALLVKEGNVYAHLIPMDSRGLRVKRVPADQELEFEYLDPGLLPGAIERFRKFGTQVGMTQAVRNYLDAADVEAVTSTDTSRPIITDASSSPEQR